MLLVSIAHFILAKPDSRLATNPCINLLYSPCRCLASSMRFQFCFSFHVYFFYQLFIFFLSYSNEISELESCSSSSNPCRDNIACMTPLMKCVLLPVTLWLGYKNRFIQDLPQHCHIIAKFQIVCFFTKELPHNNWFPNSDLLPIEVVMTGYNLDIVC